MGRALLVVWDASRLAECTHCYVAIPALAMDEEGGAHLEQFEHIISHDSCDTLQYEHNGSTTSTEQNHCEDQKSN